MSGTFSYSVGYYDTATDNIFIPLCGWCHQYHRGFCKESLTASAGGHVLAATGSLGSMADEDRLLAEVLKRLLDSDLTWHMTEQSIVLGEIEIPLSLRQRVAILGWMREE